MNVYDVIRRPLITEKGHDKREQERTLCFEVHPEANKIQIRQAVETVFKVKVADVRTATTTGKLRRRGTTEAGAQRIARLIGESQSRELFERYRQLRWRMIQQARTAALTPPAPAAAPPPADTSWSGGYRLGSDTLIAAPERFPSADSCAQWAARAAEGFRHKAYGFEFECRQGSTVIKRRLW